MKKIIISLAMVMGFVATSQAGCGESTETYLHVKNGKITKIKADVAECANMSGGIKTVKFRNGVEYHFSASFSGSDVTITEHTLNGKKVTVIKNPANIPSEYQCVKNSTMKNEAYCIKD